MRRYTIAFLCFLFLVLGGAPPLNYLVNPHWKFAREPAAPFFLPRNERFNKINRLFAGLGEYDSVLLGSSRGTFIRATDFPGKVFNFAASGMTPNEYRLFLDLFTEHRGSPDTIYLALDFWSLDAPENNDPAQAQAMIDDARAPGWLLTGLINFDTTFDSIESLAITSRPPLGAYTFDLNRHAGAVSEGEVREALEVGEIAEFDFRYADRNFTPKERYYTYLEDVRRAYPDARIVALTTPVAFPVLRELSEAGRCADWGTWLSRSVAIFGRVDHFMTDTDFARDIGGFFDPDHILPAATRELTAVIADQGGRAGLVIDQANATTIIPTLVQACQQGWPR